MAFFNHFTEFTELAGILSNFKKKKVLCTKFVCNVFYDAYLMLDKQ